MKAAGGLAGLAAFSSTASASDAGTDDTDGSELPQVAAFDERFDDLDGFSGDVSAFEVVTGGDSA